MSVHLTCVHQLTRHLSLKGLRGLKVSLMLIRVNTVIIEMKGMQGRIMCGFFLFNLFDIDILNLALLKTVKDQCYNAPILDAMLHDKSIGLVLTDKIIDLILGLWLIIMLLYIHENFNFNF